MFGFVAVAFSYGVVAPNNSALQRLAAGGAVLLCAVLAVRAFRMRAVVGASSIRMQRVVWSGNYPWSSIDTVEMGEGSGLTKTVCPRLRLRDGSVRRLQGLAYYDTPHGRSEVEAIVGQLRLAREQFAT
jgi:hypothetical protein